MILFYCISYQNFVNAIRSPATKAVYINSLKRYMNHLKKSVSLSNGFRKYVISTFIEAGLNNEIKELIVDHATGLDSSYFRPSEKQVLEEYLKAEPLLTIDPADRLQMENTKLKQKESTINQMLAEMQKKFEAVEKRLGL